METEDRGKRSVRSLKMKGTEIYVVCSLHLWDHLKALTDPPIGIHFEGTSIGFLEVFESREKAEEICPGHLILTFKIPEVEAIKC